MTGVQEYPVQVEIKNWADAWANPRVVMKTTVQTYILDPASTNNRNIQIAAYEPKRMRTVIQVIDAAVTLCLEVPRTSPDVSVAIGPAPQGRYLPPSLDHDYELYGPDEMWVNSLAAVTRVTVTKEYC